MNACHLLHGRPWLFDNDVIHDRHTNTYAFNHKGCSLTLAPLPSLKPLRFKLGKRREKSLHMSEIMERSISKCKPLFALLLLESNTSKGVKRANPLDQSLLRKFADVFPNDLHPALPPMKGIEHQIDLLLCAPLPNMPNYSCNTNTSKRALTTGLVVAHLWLH